jgi:hypothetical protein
MRHLEIVILVARTELKLTPKKQLKACFETSSLFVVLLAIYEGG